MVLGDVGEELFVVVRCPLVAALEAQGDAVRLRKEHGVAAEAVLFIQEQEDQVVGVETALQQAGDGDAHADLSEKGHGAFLQSGKLADGGFQVQIMLGRDFFLHGGDPAGGKTDDGDLLQPGGERVVDFFQTVVDLALDQGQFLPPPVDLLLLLQEQVVDGVQIPVFQKKGDLIQRHIQSAQVTDSIQALELSGAVVAVARIRIRIFRSKEPDPVIVAQNPHADMKQTGDLSDLE